MRGLLLGTIPLFSNRSNILLYISSSLYSILLGLLVIERDTSNIRTIKSAFALEPVWNRKGNSGEVIYS